MCPLSVDEGHKRNAGRSTRGQTGPRLSPLRHRSKRSHRRTRNGRNHPCTYLYLSVCLYVRLSLLCWRPIVFIHFYSASPSMSLSEALPTTAIDTVSEFTRRNVTGNCK